MKAITCIIFLFFLASCSIVHRAFKNEEDAVSYMSTADQEAYNYAFTEATKQKIFSNYNQAINLFFKCIELNSKSSAAYYQLADIYLTNGDKERALIFARNAVNLNSKNVWYKIQLARIYQVVGKKDSTVLMYQKIVKSNPKKYEYKFNLALLYVEIGEFRKAINILKELEDINGLTHEVALAMFQVYSVQKEHRSCVKILKDAIKKYPDEAKFYGLLAEHHASYGEYDEALKYYNELLKINPENEKGLLSLIEFYRANGKYSESLRLGKNFIEDDTHKIQDKIDILVSYLNDTKLFECCKLEIKGLIDYLLPTNPEDPKVHTLNADYHIKTNNLQSAKDELLFVTTKLDNNFLLWEQLFYVLSNLSDYETIYQLSEKVLVKFNDKPLIYLFRGISAYQLNKYSEAILYLKKGVTFAGNSRELEIQFYTFLGEAYHSIKDNINSDLTFERALAIDPNNLYLLNNYSYYLALRNVKLDIALTNSKKCIEIEPNNSNYIDTHGYVLFKMGKILEARQVMEFALAKGGNKNSLVIEHYLEILCKLNLRELVIQYYKLYVDLGKSSNEYINELVKPFLN